MATVSKPQLFNHDETQARVRHPLQVLRKYIRRYIILEGVALTLLCASLLFWLGLAFDFGLYKFDVDLLGVHGIDWIQELNDVDPAGGSSFWIRVILLSATIAGLVFLGVSKVVLRWLRDFNDQALALVLERRYPKQLGDRLITAVELADPNLSKKYGYSQAMVEKTILEAVEALKNLPVSAVFDWGRLGKLWLYVAASTLGMFVVTMVLFCVGSFFTEKAMTPVDFTYKFGDVASIWTERNIVMIDTYWPRRAYLEIGRFQPTQSNPMEMRVARDDARPDLQVRALEWVIADRKAPNGWRALRWKDLPTFIPANTLAAVKIANDFPHWLVDADELEPNLAAVIFTETPGRRSGEVRAYLSRANVQKKIEERGANAKLDQWLNWQEWNFDKLTQQMEDTEVRTSLRDQKVYDVLEQIVMHLETLVETPSMSRKLRRLVIPSTIEVTFRGDESSSREPVKREDGNRYTVRLQDLPKESTRFRFRARGEDYFTPLKLITLVPAPTPKAITIDKEEPAYIYHRLFGVDQSALRGLKHQTRDFALSTTGDTNTIEVPLGTLLVVHVKTDRKLRGDKSVFVKDPLILEPGFDNYRGTPPAIDADRMGFSLTMKDLTRKHDFSVEFFDEDNIRGKRRFRILPVSDMEPQLGNLNVFDVLLRKPKFKAPTVPDKEKKEEPRDLRDQAELAGAFLITPDALIKFECPVKDDYGLVRVGYHYKIRKVDFELVSQGPGKKGPTLEIDQVTRKRRAEMVASNFQFLLGNPLAVNPVSLFAGPYHLAWTTASLEEDLRRSQGYQEAYVRSEGFDKLLERKADKKLMIRPNEIQDRLTKKASPLAWEFDFKDIDEEGFDVKKLLPKLKEVDLEKFGQTHYYLQVSVQATDNNVETGATFTDETGQVLRGNTKKNKNGYIGFVIISENELLSQIAMEEETLFEKLEAVKEKVDAGLTSLMEQQTKIRNEGVDMDNILNRMNEIRTALSTSGNTIREVHQAYENIYKELVVNRVQKDRKDKIRDNIIARLENIVVPSGSYPNAEEAFASAHQLVEKEVNDKRGPSVQLHTQNMADAGRQLNKLSYDLNQVLLAMNEGIVESKLIALLAGMEREQNRNTENLHRMHLEAIERALRDLIGDEPKEEKKKK